MTRPIVLPFVSPVTGVSYYQDVVSRVKSGSLVTIVHEPENPYDNFACQVLQENHLLGYVPKVLAERLVGRGENSWEGEIVEVLPGELTGLRVRVNKARVSQKTQDKEERRDEEPKAAHQETLPEPSIVKARSGRILGALIRTDARETLVLSPEGLEVPYPTGLVILA